MFGIVSTVVATAVSLAFPVYASFKALATQDQALMRPLLMYWVVYSTGLTIESVCWPVLQFVPLYGFVRTSALLWLVLPQTQGAVQLYTRYFEPWLTSHEKDIETSIDRGVHWVRESQLGSLFLLFGVPLPEPAPKAEDTDATEDAASTLQNTLTDAVISRFRLPLTQEQLHTSVGTILAGITSYTAARAAPAPEAPNAKSLPAPSAVEGDHSKLESDRNKLLGSLSMINRTPSDEDCEYEVVDTDEAIVEADASARADEEAVQNLARRRSFWN